MSSKSPFQADQLEYPAMSVYAPRRHDAIGSVLGSTYAKTMGCEIPQDMMALLAELDRVTVRQPNGD